MQLETRIKVHEDGSILVSERLRFSRMLLDQAGPQEPELLKLLGKEAALERGKEMGEGVELVSHELRDAEGGGRESVVVFKRGDLNGFRYVSPWPAYLDFARNNVVEFKMVPRYKHEPYESGGGTMAVTIRTLKPAVSDREEKSVPKANSPLELQVFRDLGPVFRDMLKNFRLRLTLESYAPLSCGWGMRGARAALHEIDILDFSDKNQDRWGGSFLGNEELMLDLLHWNLGSENIVQNVQDQYNNPTLPTFRAFGSRYNGKYMWNGGASIMFAPSRLLFDKHFQGKKLDYSNWQPSPPEKLVTADFDKIGWKPKKDNAAKGAGDGKTPAQQEQK